VVYDIEERSGALSDMLHRFLVVRPHGAMMIVVDMFCSLWRVCCRFCSSRIKSKVRGSRRDGATCRGSSQSWCASILGSDCLEVSTLSFAIATEQPRRASRRGWTCHDRQSSVRRSSRTSIEQSALVGSFERRGRSDWRRRAKGEGSLSIGVSALVGAGLERAKLMTISRS
jgi:hypothetical protein